MKYVFVVGLALGLAGCVSSAPSVDLVEVDQPDFGGYKFYVENDDPLYLYSTVIMEQEVRVVRFDSHGIPLAYASSTHIGVNTEFLNLPQWAQDALIAHEMGHLALGHLDEEPGIDRDWYYMLWRTVDPNERDADLFAADLVGTQTVIDMLDYSRETCILVGAGSCVIEATIRAEMLRGQYCI